MGSTLPNLSLPISQEEEKKKPTSGNLMQIGACWSYPAQEPLDAGGVTAYLVVGVGRLQHQCCQCNMPICSDLGVACSSQRPLWVVCEWQLSKVNHPLIVFS